MLHHGTLLGEVEASNIYIEVICSVVNYFAPDITLGTEGLTSYKEIYSMAVHELAHAAHFSIAGVSWWNDLIVYIAKSFATGKDMYGNESDSGAGKCGVSECWAYYLQNKFLQERYGGENPFIGSGEWFHPQMFTYLEDRGFSASEIQSALLPEVVDMATLKEMLINLFPDRQTTINQVFARYE